MTPARKALTDHRAEILALAAQYRLKQVRVFGSVSREDDDAESDLDLLVESDEEVSLLELGGFLMDVRDLLGISVDVATVGMLKSRIRERVLLEAIPL
jgi:predicted nucleotidyltransferase